MILDRLASAQEKYPWLPPAFQKAFEFLSDPNTAILPDGKHELDGDRLFAIVQQYEPKPIERCRLEAHRRYWDVQYISHGEELMGWAPLTSVEVVDPHDDSRDIGFFRGPGELFHVPAGTFVIFGPHDAHMPGVEVEEPSPLSPSANAAYGGQPQSKMVRKIVVKVECS
jgi:biofilm protein TabA